MSTITAAAFPTPHLARRSTAPADATTTEFAGAQAAAASVLVAAHGDRLADPATTPATAVEILRGAYYDLIAWRAGLAAQGAVLAGQPGRAGQYVRPIRDVDRNYDAVGDLPRLRDGGAATPASEQAARAGRWALDRWEAPDAADEITGDVVRTWVALPGQRVQGNVLLRGDAARAAAGELAARLAARRPGVRPAAADLYVVSALAADRAAIHTAALRQAARVVRAGVAGDPAALALWADMTWLLYQAPQTKKGSDAVTRTFAVAVGAIAFKSPPVIPQDLDLRAMTRGRARLVRDVMQLQPAH